MQIEIESDQSLYQNAGYENLTEREICILEFLINLAANKDL